MTYFTKFTALLMILGLCSTTSVAQSTITGKVMDADGAAIYSANVYLTGTTNGAVSDDNGEYSFTTEAQGTMTIAANFVGYKEVRKEVTLVNGSDITVDFTMEQDALGLEEVVVTGVVNPKSRIESSVSMTTLDPEVVNQSAARNAAEVLRSIPGIKSESSSGDGNANISVRGAPISAGGAKYLQLQEDGLPLMQFGDIAFSTADQYLRFDGSIGRVEAIRGGAAATLASNSPAGIVNFISKTGDVEGGSVGTTFGLDYDTKRTDFSFGTPLNSSTSVHVGGFFRQGEGVRTAGYQGNLGGQIKANITKRFKKGYARIYIKHLNDRSVAYLPQPLKVEGTNDSPTISSVDGFNATTGANQSPFFSRLLSLDQNGNRRISNGADGMHSKSSYIGAEFSADLGNGWNVINRSRVAFNNGRFVAPFPESITSDTTALAEGYAGNGATLQYADNGDAFDGGHENNGLVQRIHSFDVELNNMNNVVSDTRVSKTFNDQVSVSAGLYNSVQNLSMSWLWNTYLMDVNGEGGRLLNVIDSAGNSFSQNGLAAYGVPQWGNCCTRDYNMQYATTAPYFGVAVEATDALSIDASVRFDMGHATGTFTGASQAAVDMNNDGTISGPESSVSTLDIANETVVDYDYDYVSYSAGVNYKLNETSAVFARVSQGGAAKADRILFAGANYTNGDELGSLDILTQQELGYKKRFKNGGLYATVFASATTEEGGFEASTNTIIANDYSSVGLELEGVYSKDGFTARGGLTFVDAEITAQSGVDRPISQEEADNDPDGLLVANQVGNAPRRVAPLTFSFSPSYTIDGKHTIGLSVIGQSAAYAQDINEFNMPGYTMLNVFVNANLTEGLNLTLSGNNILDTIGITEMEEGAITDNAVNYVRARTIAGRSTALTLRYNF